MGQNSRPEVVKGNWLNHIVSLKVVFWQKNVLGHFEFNTKWQFDYITNILELCCLAFSLLSQWSNWTKGFIIGIHFHNLSCSSNIDTKNIKLILVLPTKHIYEEANVIKIINSPHSICHSSNSRISLWWTGRPWREPWRWWRWSWCGRQWKGLSIHTDCQILHEMYWSDSINVIVTCKYWNISLKHCAVQFLILLTISHTTSQTLCLIGSTNWSENKETITNHLNITENIRSWTAAADCRQL